MTRLGKISIVSYVVLLFWYTLDLIGIPGFVTQDNLRSLAGLCEIILLIVLMEHILRWKYTDFFSGLWLQFGDTCNTILS